LIAGYPGETEEDFEEMKQWVRETRFDRLGAFVYSHEENTHAFSLKDDVPAEVKSSRAEEIMAIQQGISAEINRAKIGETFRMITDRKEGKYFIGRTEADSPEVDNEVLVDASRFYLRTGDFANVKITHAEEFDLYGEVV
jgi:ribosomal protein S12 methylthiotransferase